MSGSNYALRNQANFFQIQNDVRIYLTSQRHARGRCRESRSLCVQTNENDDFWF